MNCEEKTCVNYEHCNRYGATSDSGKKCGGYKYWNGKTIPITNEDSEKQKKEDD